ncbi:glycosyltransferase family 39 protein [Nocardia sp. NPDC005825]|uniref:ArnT family glycosyltransferase n=1 Tax=unclassified Nocardia TaxID=2637762 RepID=UPI0033F32C2A
MTLTLVPDPAPAAEVSPNPPVHLRIRPDNWVLAGLLVIVGTVDGWNLTNYPSLSDDEGTYLAQAWAVRTGTGLTHYTYWYDHPPGGWLQIALLSWLPEVAAPDQLAVATGRIVMVIVALINAALVFVVARRLSFTTWTAALAVLLFALSPLSVTLHRQIYLDNVAVGWMLAAFALVLSPRRHLWHHVGAGVCAAVAILSKETMLLVLPALGFALWQSAHPTTRKFSAAGLLTGVVLTGCLYPLYAVLKRELIPGAGHVSLIDGVLFQLHQRTGSGAMWQTGSASGEVVRSWLFYDRVLPVAGVIAVVAALAVRRLRAPALAGALLVGMALRPGGYLPAMYVIQALPFFALALAGLVDAGSRILLSEAVSESARRWAARGGRGARDLVRVAAVPSATWWLRWVVAAVCVAVGLSVVAPRWDIGLRRATTSHVNDEYAAALVWVREHIPAPGSQVIVVDDVLWLDMVRLGFTPGLGAIWFYKLDLDPGVRLPNGWRDVDWIVSTPTLRGNLTTLPNTADVLDHSNIAATFGHDAGRIEIRHVDKDRR